MSILIDGVIDPEAELQAFRSNIGDAGAVVSFTGQVRAGHGRENASNPVKSLFLQSHPVLTQKGILSAIDHAQVRWSLNHILVRHRVGEITPGEVIVLVAAASIHRRQAFEATDYLMDYLKTEAVFWKREVRPSGGKWIEPREEDYRDAERWRQGGAQCQA